MAVSVFDELAIQYQTKYMDTSIYHDTFDVFCNAIKRIDAHILELACGPGNITQYLLKKRPEYRILGTDMAPGMLTLAQANNPTATFRQMDCRKLNGLSGKYDGIICGFLLPYLNKEEVATLIMDLTIRLNDNGVIYLSTMEGPYETSGLQTSSSGHQMFIHNHEEAYLSNFMSDNGLDIIVTDRKIYTGYDGKPVTDLIMIAQKNDK